MTFDSMDAIALRTLMRRGRATWAELGEKLKLSAPAAAERARKLEEQGVIRGYAALVDPEAVGAALTAFVAIQLNDHGHRDKFLKRVTAIPEVVECHHVAGEHDFLIKVRCQGTRDLERVLTQELKDRAGAGRTQTTIVLHTHKETVEVPLPDQLFSKT